MSDTGAVESEVTVMENKVGVQLVGADVLQAMNSLPANLRTSSTPPGESPLRNILPRIILDGAIGESRPKWVNKQAEKNWDILHGVILKVNWPRLWYKESYKGAGSNSPPDCSSHDSINGNASAEVRSEYGVGGACETCPMKEDGSCHSRAYLYALIDEMAEEGPVLLDLPRTAVFPVRRYLDKWKSRVGEDFQPFLIETEFDFVKRNPKEGYASWTVELNAINPSERWKASMVELQKISGIINDPDLVSSSTGNFEPEYEVDNDEPFDSGGEPEDELPWT